MQRRLKRNNIKTLRHRCNLRLLRQKISTAVLVAATWSCTACVPWTVADFAARHEMTVADVEGNGFQHKIVQRFNSTGDTSLHVYIEGDGIPWSGNLPSADPTPQNTLALRLAARDSSDIAYVGRPCYFGYSTAENCYPVYWTSGRYGEEVLRSMASAIERVRLPHHTKIVLVGHSGGGALAALLESRIEGVVAVVTIGANLDIDSWTRHHHYDGLSASLNPADETRRSNTPHLQLVGRNDKTVPLYTVEGYSVQRENVELVVYDHFDHVCCWEEQWPELLDDFLARALN